MKKLKDSIYRNDSKNREIGKEASQNSCLERATIVRAQGVSEDKNFEEELTLLKNDSSGHLGITKQALSVFDLDHTLITSNCSFDFTRYLISQKELSPLILLYSAYYYSRYALFHFSPAKLHERVFARFLKGLSLERLKRHVEPFLNRNLRSILYAPVFRRLRLAQHLGHYTLLLSSSPSFLVEKIASFLSVSHWEATHYAVDKDQKLCHISSIMQGEEKAAYVRRVARDLGVQAAEITAYSDSTWDLPLLLEAGTVIAVQPDRKLLTVAKEHKWEIL